VAGVEVPNTNPDYCRFEFKAGSGHVFRHVCMTGVYGISTDARDSPEKEIQQVYAVRSQVEEQPRTGNRRIEAIAQLFRFATMDSLASRSLTVTCTDVTVPIALSFSSCRTFRKRGNALR
jgi:hypothetical protein